MDRRVLTRGGGGIGLIVTILLVTGCAHQRESFTWPWAKKNNSALAEPPLDSAARDAPKSSKTASKSGSRSTAKTATRPASSSGDADTYQTRVSDGDAFDFDAFRE